MDISALLEYIKKPPEELDPVSRAAVIMLNHAANQMCEGHTGRKFHELDDEERTYWRDQAWTSIQEWNNENTWIENRQLKKRTSKDQGLEHGS